MVHLPGKGKLKASPPPALRSDKAVHGITALRWQCTALIACDCALGAQRGAQSLSDAKIPMCVPRHDSQLVLGRLVRCIFMHNCTLADARAGMVLCQQSTGDARRMRSQA